jgi:hypothetical protein
LHRQEVAIVPSTAQGHSGQSDDLPEWRERFIETADERIGENPLRWLDHDLLESQAKRIQRRERPDTYDEVVLVVDHDVSPPGEQVRALIRGMDRIERIEVWRAAERRLGRGPDGGPRSVVIDLLDERRAELEEIGERPDRLPCGPWQSHEQWQAAGTDVDVEEIRASRSATVTGTGSAGGSASSSAGDSSRASSLGEFATDGGTEGDSSDA